MSLSSLQVLATIKDELRLVELAALLHDIGKCCDLNLEHHSCNRSQAWSNKNAYKAIVDNPGALLSLNASVKSPTPLKKILNAGFPKAADFLPPSVKDILQSTRVKVLGEDYALAELIMLGLPGFAANQNRKVLLKGKEGWLPALLGVCHSEAHVDKEKPDGEKQSIPDMFVSTAFGFEGRKIVVGDPRYGLDERLKSLSLDNSALTQPSTFDSLRKTLSFGLGDNRRPINEVTLSDWSAIVAALVKSGLAMAVLTGSKPGIRDWKEKIIDHDFRWRILRINFDALGLYSRAVKIADFLGYRERISEACDAVKRLVEEEYPLGNEVYRDTTGIYFTFPDIDLPVDLAEEIRRRVEEIEMELAPRIKVGKASGDSAAVQLRRILADQREEARKELAHPFTSENLSPCWQSSWENLPDTRREVCPVCRLRPMEEKKEACGHCLGRRRSRVQNWFQDQTRTIWMDEIADHNGRVALIVGKFGMDDWLSGDLVQTLMVRAEENVPLEPKNPSPARLRRIWETAQQFWTETVEKDILARNLYAGGTMSDLRRARLLVIPEKKSMWQENVPYDGTVNGRVISLLWREKDKSFITISNLQLVAGDAKDVNELTTKLKGRQVVVSDPDKPRRSISFVIEEAKGVADDQGGVSSYAPYLPLLASPDQFLALVPACDALSIAEKIRHHYAEQFGKVQNRLPVFLGLVFFPRKLPLAAVIDTARRMLDEVNFQEETWRIDEVDGRKVKFTNRAEWSVPTSMGDGSTFDKWYPYFFVSEDKPSYKRLFKVPEGKYKDQWLVHIAELQGKEVRVQPSRFAYLFLGHTGQRFGFDADKEALLLDDLPRLQEMWDGLKGSGITDTALRNVYALLDSKRAAWGGGSKEFKDLVQTTLRHANLSGAVKDEDVVSDRLGRCLELYLHILKQRVKGENNGKQSENTSA